MTPSTGSTRPQGRYHPRVEANWMVKVHIGERTVLVKARDLSMAGLFLHGHPADTTRQLTLTLPLPGIGDITTTCAIVRREAHGVALEFVDLDWDHFLLLARYLHPRLP
ncbi:PilZ domain-containing protein [Vitiosangium sp. GDMCC 1.1324]|uniref:PilZ domain-containing protein n=1 Tax=Vitiosangium sp. (strain GDMCC 1.1324) TaxID=2138576 RepID=UPI000D3BD6C4|nr:PilZ domain-containing protein [Vitiosangium sp. GDMCC 1.1324]PTL78406.1 PilZ domain-containing protein [Vitiosangium sp. GDMCC 1.1324]